MNILELHPPQPFLEQVLHQGSQGTGGEGR